MAYVKRPMVQQTEFFRPDVFINFRSTDSVNEETSEIKKGGVFVISVKDESGQYTSKEVKTLDFYSLMILDKLESEYERSDLVKNVYAETLQIKDKKTFKFVCEAHFDNNLKKFVDNHKEELDGFKIKKVLIGQLKETGEIFTLELAGTQARNLMAKTFARSNIYNANYDYKLSTEEKEEQVKKVELFLDGVDLKLTPSKDKYKVGKDKTFKNIFLLEIEGTTDEVTLDEKALNTIAILENQLAGNTKPSNVTEDDTTTTEEINLEDLPF